MTDPRKLSDDEVMTLASKVAVVVTTNDQTLDLTKLTREDLRAVASKAMARVDAGEAGLTDVAGNPTKQSCIKDTYPLCYPPHCDSDVLLD